MTVNVLAIAGGLSRVGVPALPVLVGEDGGDSGSADPACCMICGCPAGPCALPGAGSAKQSAGPECPLSPRAARRAGAAVLRDPELLSLATASVIVIASVVLATF
jgi:hypothetical protein